MRLAYLILTACGKQTAPAVFYKLGAGDVQPYVAAAAAAKPDFVLFSGIDAQVALFFKAFQASGIPGSHVTMPDTDFDYDPVIKAAGSSIEGAYAENQFKSWAETSDPEVKGYIAAMKASGTSVDWRSANPEWAYVDVMFLASAAKAIGYDKFNGVALQKFLSTKNGLKIPLGRTLVNPGPKKFRRRRTRTRCSRSGRAARCTSCRSASRRTAGCTGTSESGCCRPPLAGGRQARRMGRQEGVDVGGSSCRSCLPARLSRS